MKGLLLKDFYMTLKYCRTYILILLVFLGISIFENDNYFFLFYPPLIAGLLPATLASYDEREKWNIYSETLPYSRAQYVSAKYLVGLGLELIVFLLSAAAQAFQMHNSGKYTIESYLLFLAATLFVGLLGSSLLLPFIFRFGSEKGRLAYFIVIGVICAAGVYFTRTSSQIFNRLDVQWLPAAMVAATIALYALSWLLSILLYRRREL